MYNSQFEGKPSLLVKIYGMFEIKMFNKEIYYFIVMENLLLGMNTNENKLKIYDLKGSKINRFKFKNEGVLLDTNFKIDRNSEPIAINKDNYRYIESCLKNDCEFLSSKNVNVIDYSVLLIIDY